MASSRRCPTDPDSEVYGEAVRMLLSGQRRGVDRAALAVRGQTVHVPTAAIRATEPRRGRTGWGRGTGRLTGIGLPLAPPTCSKSCSTNPGNLAIPCDSCNVWNYLTAGDRSFCGKSRR